MEAILKALAAKLDAAHPLKPVEFETEVDAIRGLIWDFHDALQSARETWLRGSLPNDAYERLAALPTPGDLDLLEYVNVEQARKARAHEQEIGKRLGRRTAALARIERAIGVLEGPAASGDLAIGGGVVVTAIQSLGHWSAVQRTSQWSAIRHIPQKGVFPGWSHESDPSHVLDQTLHGHALAAAIINWWLRLGYPLTVAARLPPRRDSQDAHRGAHAEPTQLAMGPAVDDDTPTEVVAAPTKPSIQQQSHVIGQGSSKHATELLLTPWAGQALDRIGRSA